jgi:hypothetical protein
MKMKPELEWKNRVFPTQAPDLYVDRSPTHMDEQVENSAVISQKRVDSFL